MAYSLKQIQLVGEGETTVRGPAKAYTSTLNSRTEKVFSCAFSSSGFPPFQLSGPLTENWEVLLLPLLPTLVPLNPKRPHQVHHHESETSSALPPRVLFTFRIVGANTASDSGILYECWFESGLLHF